MSKKVRCKDCGHTASANAGKCKNCGCDMHPTKEASTINFMQSMWEGTSPGAISSQFNSNFVQKLAEGEKKPNAGEFDDSHMLSKILLGIAKQSSELKHKIDSGLVLPSWAEYKIYGAYDNIKGALGATYMEDNEQEKQAYYSAADREDTARQRAGLAGAVVTSAALAKLLPPHSHIATNMPVTAAILKTLAMYAGGHGAVDLFDAYRARKQKKLEKVAARRFSAPPLEGMNLGNSDAITNRAMGLQQSAPSLSNSTMQLPPPPPAQMRPMEPQISKPFSPYLFSPKYTGM